MSAARSTGPSWGEVLGVWPLVEYTFATRLRVHLDAERHARTWRWFTVMVAGLLADDTPLARHFADDEPDPDEEPDDE